MRRESLLKSPLTLAAAGEASAGLALMAYPAIVAELLFGGEPAGAGVPASRVAGLALIGLGVACWPTGSARQPSLGMLAYVTLAGLYLVYLGVGGEAVGRVLWPAVSAHAILAVLLLRPPVRGAVRGWSRCVTGSRRVSISP